MKIGIKIQFLSAGHPILSRIMKFAKIGVRIQFLSAGHIDIHNGGCNLQVAGYRSQVGGCRSNIDNVMSINK